jgi:hypothetical protein
VWNSKISIWRTATIFSKRTSALDGKKVKECIGSGNAGNIFLFSMQHTVNFTFKPVTFCCVRRQLRDVNIYQNVRKVGILKGKDEISRGNDSKGNNQNKRTT